MDTGIEVEIYRDSAPSERVAILEGRTSPQFLEEIRNHGAGSFTISRNDPKIVADPSLLAYRNIVKFRVDGKVQGGFVIQTKKATIIGAGEESEAAWAISGEGLRCWFKDAIVYPALGLQSGSVETRYFNFASERGTWYKSSDWPTATTLANIKETWTHWGSNFWPSNWPDVPQASWIWSRGFDSNNYMPKGFSYFRHEFTTTEPGSYSLFFAIDDAAELYVDGELVLTTVEHASFETTRYDMDLGAGPHIIAFKGYNSFVTGGPAGLVAALLRAGNATAPTSAELLSYTGQSTWKAMDYPANEPGWSVGEILLKLLDEAKTRGVRFPNNITTTFTATKDSSGADWDAPLPWSFNLGSTYEEVLQSMEELACDVFLDPADLKLYAWNKRGTDLSLYSDAVPKSVALRKGLNLQEADETGQASITNTLVLKTADGWREVDSPNGTSQLIYGVIESQMATGLGFDASKKLTDEVFRQRAMPELSATYTIIPVPGAVPFIDFNVGDWVSAPESVTNGLVKRRVMSIAVTENEVGTPVFAVEFDTIFKDRQTELERYVQRATNSSLGGGFTNTTGVGNSVQNPKPTNPGKRRPKVPQNVRVEANDGYFANDNTPRTRVKIAWDATPQASDGSPLSIQSYEVWNRLEVVAGNVPAGTLSTTSTAVVQDGWASGVVRYVKVRSQSYDGSWSDFSPEIRVVPAAPLIQLDPPTAPTLTTALATVTATWDGKLTTGNPPLGFKETRVERKVVTNGVTTWTQVGTSLTSAGYAVLAKLKVGDTETFRLRAFPVVGDPSEPSTEVSIKVDGIQIPDIDGAIIDAIDKAQEDADAALTTADGKNTAYYQTAQPSGGTYKKGDMWFDTDDGYRLYVYTGSGWLLAQDAAAADTKASAALTSANGKNTNYYSSTTPTAPTGGFKTGDSWFDTANNNALRVWNGTAWILAQDSFTASSKADTALTTANGKNKVIRAGTQPSGTNYVKGDLWFNSADGNKMYEWSGSAWVLAEFGTNALSNTAITAGKLADSAVTAVKLANGAVDSTKLATAVNTAISTAQSTATNAQTVADQAKASANALNQSAENKVSDPSFANGVLSGLPAGWSIDSSKGRSDAFSLTRVGNAATNSVNLIQAVGSAAVLPVAVSPGDTWELSGWYQTTSDWNGTASNSKLRLGSQTNAGLSAHPAVVAGKTSWTYVSVRYQVPQDGSVTSLRLTAFGDNTAGQIWWDDVALKNITSAVAAEVIAGGAQTAADAAKAAADAAKGVADAAKISADGKNRIYRQSTQPTGAVAGDTWFDTANGNQIAVYNGSSWVRQTFGSDAISSAAIDSTKLAAAVNTSITNAMTAASDAQAGVNAALMKTLNRVTDPSFGSGVMGGLGGGWSIVGNKGRSDNFSLTRTAQSGSSSVVLTQVAGSDNNTFLHIPASPGQTWEIGGWVTTTSNYNGTNGNSKLRLADQNNALIGAGTVGIGSPRLDWTWESTRYTVPNDSSVKSLRLTVVADNTAGQIWWDDVVLRDVTDVVAAEQASAAALTAANGKNRTIYSLGDPSGQGTRDGDLWYKTDANSLILGVWFWDDSAKTWNKRKIDGQTIDNLDAGTITVGFMNGNRIQANTIMAEKLMVGNFTNLIPDSTLQYPLNSGAWRAATGTLSNWEIVNTSGLPGQALHITKQTAWGEHRLAAGGKQAVNPGEKYAIGGRSRISNWTGTTPRIRLAYRNTAGTLVGNSGELQLNSVDSWNDFSVIATIPNVAEIAYAEFEIRVYSDAGGDLWVGNIFWRQATTGNLLVDGAIQAGSAIIAEGAIGNAQIGDAAITNAKIANLAVTDAKISSLNAGKINAGFISGDRIQGNTITGTMIQGATITASNMVSGTITAASGIIANAAIGEAKIIDGAITTAKIDSAAITNAKIANGAITDAKIANATILNASIADGAITNAKIANATITTAKISELDAAKIVAGTITGDKIGANTITTDKILVGSFQNFITDPALIYPLASTWKTYQGSISKWDIVNTTGLPGTALRGTFTTSDTDINRLGVTAMVDVAPSDKMVIGGRVRVDKTSGSDPAMRVMWRSATGSLIAQSSDFKLSGTWTDYSTIVTAPDNADVSRAQFEIVVPSSFVGTLWLGKLFWRMSTPGTVIEDGAISTDKIAASAITAGKIAVGTITGDKVAANTISVSKLLVTSLENLVQDGGFEYASTEAWTLLTNTTMGQSSVARTGSNAMRITSSSGAFVAARANNFIPVNGGERYRLSAWVRTNSGTATATGIALRMATQTSQDGSTTTQSDTTITQVGQNTTYTRIHGVFTVPSSAKFMRLEIVCRDTSASNLIYLVDDVEIFKMASAELIVDGAITADKIATNAVTADAIAANAVKANNIEAGAIDGKLITGAVIQTDVGNTGLKINNNGMQLFNSSGQQTVNLNASDGSATITGTLRNRVSGSRVVISSTADVSTINFYTPNTVSTAKIQSEGNAGGSGEGIYMFAGANSSNAGSPSTLQLYENGNNGASGARLALIAGNDGVSGYTTPNGVPTAGIYAGRDWVRLYGAMSAANGSTFDRFSTSTVSNSSGGKGKVTFTFANPKPNGALFPIPYADGTVAVATSVTNVSYSTFDVNYDLLGVPGSFGLRVIHMWWLTGQG